MRPCGTHCNKQTNNHVISQAKKVKELLAANNLSIKNTGNTPTWVTSWGDLVIDITITNKQLEDKVTDWSVNIDYYTGSDHKLIMYNINYISNLQTFESSKLQ
jgi:hypothetical protein